MKKKAAKSKTDKLKNITASTTEKNIKLSNSETRKKKSSRSNLFTKGSDDLQQRQNTTQKETDELRQAVSDKIIHTSNLKKTTSNQTEKQISEKKSDRKKIPAERKKSRKHSATEISLSQILPGEKKGSKTPPYKTFLDYSKIKLPESYDKNELLLIARDSKAIFAHWDVKFSEHFSEYIHLNIYKSNNPKTDIITSLHHKHMVRPPGSASEYIETDPDYKYYFGVISTHQAISGKILVKSNIVSIPVAESIVQRIGEWRKTEDIFKRLRKSVTDILPKHVQEHGEKEKPVHEKSNKLLESIPLKPVTRKYIFSEPAIFRRDTVKNERKEAVIKKEKAILQIFKSQTQPLLKAISQRLPRNQQTTGPEIQPSQEQRQKWWKRKGLLRKVKKEDKRYIFLQKGKEKPVKFSHSSYFLKRG